MFRCASTILMLVFLLLPHSLTGAQDGTFPAPTGPYTVGTMSYYWVDDTREETMTTDVADDLRELMVRVWYPADAVQDAEEAPAMLHAAVQIPVIEREFGAMGMLRGDLPDDEIAAIGSHAVVGAPLAEADASYPVLVFSHGWLGSADLHTIQLAELASHGYVVAAISHPYTAAATVYPDGRVAEFRDTLPPAELIPLAVADVKFVLDQMDALNARDPGGTFSGGLDLTRVGIFGMSFGGAVATVACAEDDRCKAMVNEDGFLFDHGATVLSQPAMFMYSVENARMNEGAYVLAKGPAYSLTFGRFGHGNFTDAPLWPGVTTPDLLVGPADPLASEMAVNAYVLAFFDSYLKGEVSALLDEPPADYPGVDIRSRNVE